MFNQPELWTQKDTQEKTKEKFGIKLTQEKHFPDETDEEKEIRKQKRHEKFGELAKE